MKTERVVAVLAMAGGAFEIVNALVDVSAHGDGSRDADWVFAVALSILMGALLATAGAVLLRRGAAGARLARGVAVAALALVVALQIGFPFMSIFSRLLGVCLPIAILLVSRRPRGLNGRDPSVPAVA